MADTDKETTDEELLKNQQQVVTSDINSSYENMLAANQKNSGTGAEAATGTTYSWDKEASKTAKQIYGEELNGAINGSSTTRTTRYSSDTGLLANNQSIQQSRESALNDTELTNYTNNQSADKMGWSNSGYQTRADYGEAFMKNYYASNLYTATQLQKAGYNSAIAQSAFLAEEGLAEASNEKYQEELDQAYKEYSITGVYLSPELREMTANRNLAQEVLDNQENYSQDEIDQANKVKQSVDKWFTANNISESGIYNIEKYTTDIDDINNSILTSLQIAVGQLTDSELANAANTLTQAQKDYLAGIESDELSTEATRQQLYEAYKTAWDNLYGSSIYNMIDMNEDGTWKINSNSQLGTVDINTMTQEELSDYCKISDEAKGYVKGVISNIKDKIEDAYLESIKTQDGTDDDGNPVYTYADLDITELQKYIEDKLGTDKDLLQKIYLATNNSDEMNTIKEELNRQWTIEVPDVADHIIYFDFDEDGNLTVSYNPENNTVNYTTKDNQQIGDTKYQSRTTTDSKANTTVTYYTYDENGNVTSDKYTELTYNNNVTMTWLSGENALYDGAFDEVKSTVTNNETSTDVTLYLIPSMQRKTSSTNYLNSNNINMDNDLAVLNTLYNPPTEGQLVKINGNYYAYFNYKTGNKYGGYQWCLICSNANNANKDVKQSDINAFETAVGY